VKYLHSRDEENQIITAFSSNLNFYQKVGMATPIVAMLTLVNVSGCYIELSRRYGYADSEHQIDRDLLLLPGVIVEDYHVDVPKLLKPVFDTIWQSAGWDSCKNYDLEGNRISS
jgi:hypothetical protein